MITEHSYKTGQRPGFVFIIEGDSEDAVRSTVASFPFVSDDWFGIEIEPVVPLLSDLG